ncbi:MAG: 3-dehydroquinate synthase II [bacterium]
MAKRFWVEAKRWNKDLVTAALESGAEAVKLPKGKSAQAKRLGILATLAPDGDLKPGQDFFEVSIRSRKDEERALRLPADRFLVVRTADWKVIPLENLVAARGRIIAAVSGAQEAKLALEIMEKGTEGILLATDDPAEVRKTARLLQEGQERFDLARARIQEIRPLGMGDRVCIDTCTRMEPGEGMLVGNASSGMFLVHAENVETPYCATRPFRVNAGAVHAYVQAPGGRTLYLADLQAGDDVLVVNAKGRAQVAYVGRAKIERRPLVLVTAESKNRQVGLILQNAETIRLTQPGGQPVSIATLKKGSEVLACFGEAGRHFGMKVEETITEK